MRESLHRKVKKRRRAMKPQESRQPRVHLNPPLMKHLPVILQVKMLRKLKHQSKITEGGTRCLHRSKEVANQDVQSLDRMSRKNEGKYHWLS